MSDQNDRVGQVDHELEPLREFWKKYVQLAADGTRQLPSWLAIMGPDVLSPARLDEVSRVLDIYLRSPDFLAAMRQRVESLVAAKVAQVGSVDEQGMPTVASAGPRGGSQPAGTTQASSASWDAFLDLTLGPGPAVGHGAVGVTPYDVVYQAGTLRLLRFRSEAPTRFAEPVLICYSLVNRPYVLDLQADRSVVRQLLRAGLDVYLIDWGVPTAADHRLGLHDYICFRMRQAVDFLCELTHSHQISLLGYCMGGTMSAIFTAIYPPRVRNLILLAAPIDFSVGDSLLSIWAREEYFDVDALINAFGNCPGWFLRICFQQTKPVHNYVQKYLTLHERREDASFLENFFAVERWAYDSIPVAGEAFREFVKQLYQCNQLVQGDLRLQDRCVDLKSVSCPLLILVASLDHLVPPPSALAVRDRVASSDVEVMSIDAGHLGLVVSSKAQRQLWPDAASWITNHSTEREGDHTTAK